MQNTKLQTIQRENLENVTGGGYLDMLSGGRLNIGTMLGGGGRGGAFGVNKEGNPKSLSEGISGLMGFGGGGPIRTVEGRDR